MALTNIGREPRREITEQLIGVVFTIGYLIGDYKFATWVYPGGFWKDPGDFMLMALGLFFIPAIILFLHVTHKVGEIVCSWLPARVDPRPRQRY